MSKVNYTGMAFKIALKPFNLIAYLIGRLSLNPLLKSNLYRLALLFILCFIEQAQIAKPESELARNALQMYFLNKKINLNLTFY